MFYLKLLAKSGMAIAARYPKGLDCCLIFSIIGDKPSVFSGPFGFSCRE
jgi:hypothetical protein